MGGIAKGAPQHLNETSFGAEALREGATRLRRAAVNPGDDKIGRLDQAQRFGERDAVIVVADERFDRVRDGADAFLVSRKNGNPLGAFAQSAAKASQHARAADDQNAPETLHSAASACASARAIQPPPNTRLPPGA